MEIMGITTESDKTWMKFADIMIETGLIADCIENMKIQQNVQGS
jgi:hypothetical protein